MTPLSVVTWKWHTPGYRSVFGPGTVNTLRRMVARHYPDPHRFICVTDDATGLDPEIEVVPAWNDYASVPSPQGARNPSCYRRLRAFDPEIGSVFGPRFVSIDLDVVITADLRPLWQRPEDFVIWGDTNPRTFYNGSMLLMNAGARPKVWTDFDARRSPVLSRAAGHFGSDQGWISYCLGPGETKWSRSDGVISFRNDVQPRGYNVALPRGARVVVFHGSMDPWSPIAQRNYGWIREHYQ
jgi:hypothetical protein